VSDEEVRAKRSRSRKKNIMARALYDRGDHKGAFAIRIVSPKQGEYKRERMKVTEINEEDYD